MILFNCIDKAKRACDYYQVIGHSVLGREILAFVKGDDSKGKILIHGSIHAREYITSRLICDMIENYSGEAQVCFVPVVNPDGVALVANGLQSVPKRWHNTLLKYNNGSDSFCLWKANINGVDLNVNFDADWGCGIKNIRHPYYENYIGPFPFSEPETIALRGLSLQKTFDMTISYHSKGKEIYWGYKDYCDLYDEALEFSKITGYKLLKSEGSAGGYKDWFTKYSKRLGITIEVGDDILKHPLKEGAYQEIWRDNMEVANLASDIIMRNR